MSLISRQLAIIHTRAQVLAQIAGEQLSAFEHELIADIAKRRAAFGSGACVTDLEATILTDAVEGMETALRRTFADNREAFCATLVRIAPIVGEAA